MNVRKARLCIFEQPRRLILLFLVSIPFCPLHHAGSRLQDLGQLSNDGVARLRGLRVTAHVLRPQARINSLPDGLLDGLGLLGQVQRVAQHHGDGQDGADGVDDALAGDVGRRT